MIICENKSKASANILRIVLEQLQYLRAWLSFFAPTHSKEEAVCENMQDESSMCSSL